MFPRYFESHNHEFKNFVKYKILATPNPEFKILENRNFEFMISESQNPELKILPDLGFKGVIIPEVTVGYIRLQGDAVRYSGYGRLKGVTRGSERKNQHKFKLENSTGILARNPNCAI